MVAGELSQVGIHDVVAWCDGVMVSRGGGDVVWWCGGVVA